MTLRKRITPEFLPILARAQWALAADVMRRADGGDLISRAALHKFRELATSTDYLIALVEMTGNGEIYTVALYDFESQKHTDRDLIEWAVIDYYNSEEALRVEGYDVLDRFLREWRDTEWRFYGK
jgi:hypothetical protein